MAHTYKYTVTLRMPCSEHGEWHGKDDLLEMLNTAFENIPCVDISVEDAGEKKTCSPAPGNRDCPGKTGLRRAAEQVIHEYELPEMAYKELGQAIAKLKAEIEDEDEAEKGR